MEGMEPEEGLARKAYTPGYRPRDPVPAGVPGIVQNALLEAGRIEDPYYEMNNEKILWVEEKEWWFFKEFTVPEKMRGESYRLVFKGITYRANVWLNGINIGNVEGMFLRHFFDVTRLLIPGHKNHLTLRLRTLENSSEDRPGGEIERGTVRSSGVVAPFTYWWNWSPHLVPVGIWKPVWLEVTGGVFLGDPQVRTEIHWDECQEAESATVKIRMHVESTYDKLLQVRLREKVTGIDFSAPEIRIEEEIMLKPGENALEHTCLIPRPQLWWPNGLGGHPLYRLQVCIEDRDGVLLEETETEFGVRELSIKPNEDDLWVQKVHGQSNRQWSIVGNPYPWTFWINKKRIFIRGSNWLPTDNLFRFSEDRYRLFLDQAAEANLNMLRVWGGGIQETKTFYRLCDRKGILTWVEFWLACADYPVMPRDLFLRCAVDQLKQVRNHPSVVLWSGGNEYNPDEPENKELVDRLADTCRRYDPTRPFRRGSPYKGDRHGGLMMLPTRTSNKYGDILNGDTRLTLFRSEVAVMRSAPVLESIKKFIGEENIWPINKKVWQYHHAVITEQERDAREYGAVNELKYWLMAGQLAHGQNHRHNMEYCRQTKYWCSGCLQWSLNGSWPSFHRELIDWYGQPKPAYYAYKRACRNYLILADLEKYVFEGNEAVPAVIYAVNDRYSRLGECRVKATVYDLYMKKLYEQEGTVTVEADVSVKAFTLNWRVPRNYLRKVFFLHLQMEQHGKLLAENLYWLGTSAYCRPDQNLNLNGFWQFQLSGEQSPAALAETGWQDCLMPSHWHKPPQAPGDGRSVFYRKKVTIPANWEGTLLEFFCAGMEGNDEVYWNKTKIGATEEEMTIEPSIDDLVFTEKWVKNIAAKNGEENFTSKPVCKRDRQNIRMSSDPFIVPNLIKRFYPIPAELINWGKENILEIRLYGRHATGISEPVFIRRSSTEKVQQAVIDFDNDGAYLSALRDLPPVDLEARVFCDNPVIIPGQKKEFYITLHNNSPAIGFFIALDLEVLDDNGEPPRLLYLDNYFSLLPGAEKTVVVKMFNDRCFTGERRFRFSVGGWNVREKSIGRELKVLFQG